MSTVDGVRQGAVVVGVDGSKESMAALDVAAGEALRRGRPLRVVCAFHGPLVTYPVTLPGGVSIDERITRGAREAVDGATRRGGRTTRRWTCRRT